MSDSMNHSSRTNQVKATVVFTFFVLSCVMLEACKPIESVSVQNGEAFFYPTLGMSVIYDVEEIEYSLNFTVVFKKYQLKETLVSSSTDVNGSENLRIEQYRREDDNQKWMMDSVFIAKKEIDKSLKTENNITYLKFIYPLSEGLRWNGNTYNALGNNIYELRILNKPFQLNGQNFNKTVSVFQQNDSTLVDLKRRVEVYAEGIGMIYKEITNVSYCNSGDCLGKGKIDFGTKYIFKIKSYEK